MPFSVSKDRAFFGVWGSLCHLWTSCELSGLVISVCQQYHSLSECCLVFSVQAMMGINDVIAFQINMCSLLNPGNGEINDRPSATTIVSFSYPTLTKLYHWRVLVVFYISVLTNDSNVWILAIQNSYWIIWLGTIIFKFGNAYICTSQIFTRA